jgi:ribosomal protein S18 acetylase RimI-like enzyme
MQLTQAPCVTDSDLDRARVLVHEAVLAGGSTRHWYPHKGDIEWWNYYAPDFPLGQEIRGQNQFWQAEDGRLAVWCIVLPEDHEYNILPHPDFDTPEVLEFLVDHYERELTPSDPPKGFTLSTYDIEADTAFRQILLRRGYSAKDWIVIQHQTLDTLPNRPLPAGYSFLDRMTPAYVAERAALHRAAFSPTSRMTTEHYAHFMSAPLYDPELDIVAVGPDGSLAGYAMTWLDRETGVGHFEPVGTRTDLQRQGIGKAVMAEGLRRLKARGMHSATVGTGFDNAPNRAFYTSIGFEPVTHAMHFEKVIVPA